MLPATGALPYIPLLKCPLRIGKLPPQRPPRSCPLTAPRSVVDIQMPVEFDTIQHIEIFLRAAS